LETLKQRSTLLSPSLVENDRLDMPDIRINRVTQEKQVRHGQHQSEEKSHRVAENVQQLFTGDRKRAPDTIGEHDPSPVHCPASLFWARDSVTNTSSRFASAS